VKVFETARLRVERVDRIVKGLAVDIRQDADAVAAKVAAERVEQQLGAQRRAANADVQQAVDLAERSALDGVDQRAHALVLRPGAGDVVRRALPALGDMSRGPPFARIDDGAGEQGLARSGEVLRFRQLREGLQQAVVEVRFRPVEMDSGNFD
jgi:hypothetical protein